jgi:hypothetical protein
VGGRGKLITGALTILKYIYSDKLKSAISIKIKTEPKISSVFSDGILCKIIYHFSFYIYRVANFIVFAAFMDYY